MRRRCVIDIRFGHGRRMSGTVSGTQSVSETTKGGGEREAAGGTETKVSVGLHSGCVPDALLVSLVTSSLLSVLEG